METIELKRVGLKVTGPRLKILHILEANPERHMSAEDVYRRLHEGGAEIGLATVYRVLTQFDTAGIVNKHNFEGAHSVYEINQGDHHDHLVCAKCGRVEEFCDELIEHRQELIAEQYGYQMTDHSLNIYGICPICQQAA